MRHQIFYPHERRALSANGIIAAGRNQSDFVPIVRLWFPATPLSWLLTHTLAEDDDLAYGLSVQHGDRPTYELGLWSLAAFEGFAEGDPRTRLQCSSVFSVTAPLSCYIRSLIRRRSYGY